MEPIPHYRPERLLALLVVVNKYKRMLDWNQTTGLQASAWPFPAV